MANLLQPLPSRTQGLQDEPLREAATRGADPWLARVGRGWKAVGVMACPWDFRRAALCGQALQTLGGLQLGCASSCGSASCTPPPPAHLPRWAPLLEPDGWECGGGRFCASSQTPCPPAHALGGAQLRDSSGEDFRPQLVSVPVEAPAPPWLGDEFTHKWGPQDRTPAASTPPKLGCGGEGPPPPFCLPNCSHLCSSPPITTGA